MTAAAIIAYGAISSLGEGEAAFRSSAIGEPAASCVARDAELALAGLTRPWAARAALGDVGRDRATELLERALADCARSLDAALPGWRSLRVGAAIGTSSGGMRSFEAAAEAAHAQTYVGPVVDAARPCDFEPFTLLLGACASSTLAIGLGRAWLLADRCDLVLAGGFDAVSVFVAAGFESLRATSARGAALPFRSSRDGLVLGEGAALVALTRADRAGVRGRAYVCGFGATCDALHLTAPDPAGSGLERAARLALEDAALPSSAVGLVSAHGTATPQNDAAEARAITALSAARAHAPPVTAFKGTIGHTLGAAGALEVLATISALESGIVPASAGSGAPEPGIELADRTTRAMPARTSLKLSAAFGGANAALVVSLDAPQPPPPRRARPLAEAWVSRAVFVTMSEALSAPGAPHTDRAVRGDMLVALSLAAVAKLEQSLGGGGLRGAGIIVGHGLATIETNTIYQARIRAKGAARAEPRRFAYTTPNAAAGECAAAFGLTGPAFAVGAGPHGGLEALAVAADLVRAGAVGRVVVVAVDAPGEAAAALAPGTVAGAVALVVSAVPEGAVARIDRAAVRLEAAGPRPAPLPPMTAHAALLPLASARERAPAELLAAVPWGGTARVTLKPWDDAEGLL